ncbi:MAG: tetratricopeptide repeat protein [Saprospiraceae bacterium]|nr:tetratricopeptide repeat protein [Saprospiraceae bacterium]
MMTQRMIDLMKLLEDDPNDSFILFAIAKEYESLNMLDQALNYYLTLQRTNPSYVGLYYHLAKLYEELGKVEDALNIYDEGIFMAGKMHDQHALAELKNARTNLELMM